MRYQAMPRLMTIKPQQAINKVSTINIAWGNWKGTEEELYIVHFPDSDPQICKANTGDSNLPYKDDHSILRSDELQA